MIVTRVRKAIAEAAIFVILVTVTPTVYAMSEVESRQVRRVVQTQMLGARTRHRALARRYGVLGSMGVVYQFAG